MQIFLRPNLRFTAAWEDPHRMDPVVSEAPVTYPPGTPSYAIEPTWAAAHQVNRRYWTFQMQAMF